MKRNLGLVVAALLSLCVACGDDDGGGGSSGAAGAGATGGSGGTGGGGGTGGSGGTGGGGADRDTVCSQICASIEALNCSGDGDNCTGDCAATWDETLCQSETQALLVCSAGRPASAWECDEFDEAALNDGCDTEGAAVATCILNSL